MKLRFQVRQRGRIGHDARRSMTVSVPFHKLTAVRSPRGGLMPLDVAADWIAAFEARHYVEVLEIRRPCRRVRAW
jgi:hypothetical protein